MFSISYFDRGKAVKVADIDAARLDYTGCDGFVIAVFRDPLNIKAIATLQPGMVVERKD